MSDFVMPLMLGLDVASLTMSLVNIASPRGSETALADSVEAALRPLAHLTVSRAGATVVAATAGGHASRVGVLAQLSAPAADDPLAYVEMGKLHGPGASGAKGALAVALKAAAAGGFARDVTFVFGEGDVPAVDFAVLALPTASAVVGGALDDPHALRLAALAGGLPVTGGTDELASLGVPAVAFGPGDASLAGTPGEFVPTAELTQCEFALRRWLEGATATAGW